MPQPETGGQQQPGSQSSTQSTSGSGSGKQDGGQQPQLKLTEVETLEMNQVGGQEAIAKKIDQVADKLAQDVQLVGFNYSWRGICKRCGWQTMQFDQQSAHALVKRHALKHWRELLPEMAQQQQAGQQGQQGQQPGQQQHAPGQQSGTTPPQQAPQQRQQPAR